MSVERRNIYKVFRDGVYLGLLPTPSNEFRHIQDINTASTEIEIEIPQTLDISGEPVEPLETQDGLPIQTENEQIITTERATEIVGTKDSGRLIANGNDIEVWEYSNDHPNGVVVFSGYQSRMRGKVGDGDTLTLTVISYGKDLDDYIYGTGTFSLEMQNLYDNSAADYLSRPGQPSLGSPMLGQEFTPSSSFTATKIAIPAANGDNYQGIYPTSVDLTVKIYSGNPLGVGTLLATATATQTILFTTLAAMPDLELILSSPVAFVSGTRYFYTLTANDYIMVGSRYPNTSYPRSYSGNGTILTSQAGIDLTQAFKLYSGGVLTTAVFTGKDPTTMVTDAVAGYQSQGGTVTVGSTDLTGYSLNYTFITATILEIIEKARELSPANFYWYVDPGTGELTFKQTATTATHKFILGRHLHEMTLEASIENIKNVVYFTGGPTAGINLLKKYTDVASLATNRIGMERLNDNRILAANEPSAASIADSFMDERSGEEFTVDPITILADTYDISTIHLGDTIAIEGYGNFVDDLILQITSLERATTYARLTVGKLPFKSDSFVDAIKRNLDEVQTLDNPTAPS